MRCALVEFTPFHGETIPTFVLLLRRLGIEVDLYLRSEVCASDPFAFTGGLDRRQYRLESWSVRATVKTRHFASYDFVLATSCEPRSVLPRLSAISTPFIGVVHNAVLLLEDDEYRRFFGHRRRRPLVLARHQERYLGPEVGARWVAPLHLVDDPTIFEPDWNRFCVQGWIDVRRRNYADLLDAVERLDRDGLHDFEIMLLGMDYGLDGLRFRRDLAERGLDRYFDLTGEQPDYREYFSAIASCGFVLPLVDSSPHLRMYFQDKITSSISIALGSNRIPVVHSDLAELYDLRSLCVDYPDGELADAMHRALSLPDELLRDIQEGLDLRRAQLLDASCNNLHQTLAEIGISTPRPPS
jgi:glycosyltransferase involved in cell wall biosynthesis